MVPRFQSPRRHVSERMSAGSLLTDLQRQIGEREDQLQAMYSDPELQKVFTVCSMS